MKKSVVALGFAFLLSHAAQGATMIRLLSSGDWATASEWANSVNMAETRVPIIGDTAVLNNNCSATVSSVISQTPDNIVVNNQTTATSSTLTISSSGSLAAKPVTGAIYVGSNDAQGIIRMTNGASLSGSSMTVGNAAAARPSTLHLILGPSGFANPIAISGALTIRPGQKLVVDASAYTGGVGDIALINYGSLSGSFTTDNITITGLTNRTIAYDGRSMKLVIPDTRTDLEKVLDLGNLTSAPVLRADDFSAATTNVAAGQMKAVYFDALTYSGSPTRVYAWLGIPAGASSNSRVPGVVLVHGGGGTAYSAWVQKWMDRGYAAISIAVEGQTDATNAPTMNTGWHIHNMPGPVRVGIFGDSATTLVNQWIYHAVADTVLANSLLRSLPEVNASKVGVMGISWGGVITSTAMGLDDRFAFAVPVYGCGHLDDIPNQYGNALSGNTQYKTLWDSSLRMTNATMPALWLSWPTENNFSLDSQAATYLPAPGPRMVSLVPGMGHGHSPAWNRPESYDFADSVVTTGTNWCSQQSLSLSNGTATVVFNSTKTLNTASLIYTTGTGYTGNLTWPETNVTSLVQSPAGTWTVTAAVPTNATAWFINVKATATSGSYSDTNLIVTSDYQEIVQTTNAFSNGSGDGLWSTAANWSLGSVPSGAQNAVVNQNKVATIAVAAPAVDTVTVGNTASPQTKLIIQANLSATNFRVASAGTGTRGQVEQNGGAVNVSSALLIAANAAGVDTGTYMVSGGSLSAATLTVGTQGTGVLHVNGNAAASVSTGTLSLGSAATLKFTLGTLGVTRLQVTGAWSVHAASRLEIDGTNYEGMDGFFPIVEGGSVTGSFGAANITFTGFGTREPALVYQNGDLWLRVLPPVAASSQLLSLVPTSTVAADYASATFTTSRALAPSGSAWSLTWNEAHVMDARLTQEVTGATNRSWDLRIGRGGHLYSFRTTALGELVPPQYRGNDATFGTQYAPWNDEVWQGVAVDTVRNNLPDGSYYIHQSGVYLRDPALTEPFYSPQVAAAADAGTHSFTTINWGQHAHLDNYTDATSADDFQSHLLCFTRYRDLGQGVIEVSLGLYNYGADNLNWFNMPWGGVRRSTTEYAFMSQPGGTAWDAITNGFGDASPDPQFNSTGGWMAFSNNTNGTTPSLALVCGFDSAPLITNQYAASFWNKGYAGGATNADPTAWRNYFVTTAIRRYTLTRGRGIWGRYYFALGDSVSDVAARIAARGLATNATLSAFNYPTATTPLIGYRTTGSGTSFRVIEDNVSPQFKLYAHPVANSFPIYDLIAGDGLRYLTWNPYEAAPIKTYTGQIAGIRLLGFALRSADMPAAVISAPLTACLAPSPSNYRASGETLSAGVATAIEAWRAQNFATTANTDSAADDADTDRDGVVNLIEYATQMNPSLNDVVPQSVTKSGSVLDFIYTKNKAATDVTYIVEWSDTLLNDWSTIGVTQSLAPGSDNGITRQWRAAMPAGTMRRFARLKVTRP